MRSVTLAAIILLTIPSWGAVAYDNATGSSCLADSTCTAGNTTLTYSHTTGSGSNRAMVVFVCVSGPSATVQPAVSTVTYAAVSLSKLREVPTSSPTYYCDLWTLANGTQPTTGANNVIVVLASALGGGSDIIMSIAITTTGVDQSQTWKTSSDAGNSGSGTSATLTLGGSDADGLGVIAVCSGTTGSKTANNATNRATVTGNDLGACNTMAAGTVAGGTTNPSYTIPSDSWRTIGAAFKAAGAATASRTPAHGDAF